MTLTTLAIISGSKNQLSSINENEPPYSETKELLRDILESHCRLGVKSFYVNCEYGIPLWAAEIICELRKKYPVELHIVMPYEEQATDWSEDIRERYFAIHEQSDSVCIVSTHYHEGCYEQAEEIMLKNSDALLVHGIDNKFAESYAAEHGIHLAHF